MSCAACNSTVEDGFPLFRFPDPRKHPATYNKWCSVLNIEPADEKVDKPLVCRYHFNPRDIDGSGHPKPSAAPKRRPIGQRKKVKQSAMLTKKQLKYNQVTGERIKFDEETTKLNSEPTTIKRVQQSSGRFIKEPTLTTPENSKSLRIKEKADDGYMACEISLEPPRFNDGSNLFTVKTEPTDEVVIKAEYIESPLLSEVTQIQSQCLLDDEEDVEFLESLRVDMTQMSQNQKSLFKSQMLARFLFLNRPKTSKSS